MAEKFGLNATKRDVDRPENKIYTGEVYGKLRIAFDEYSLPDSGNGVDATELAANDLVKLCEIPKGARLHDVIFSHDALGGGTISLGWEDSEELDSLGSVVEAADAVGILPNTTAITAAGVVRMSDAVASGINKKFNAKVRLSLKVETGPTSAAIGSGFKVTIIYSVE
jgi:hypothetical protein